jgi:peptidoglycan/xylan/chitin deacetylase (PgdA/CDA1 family)
MLVLPVVHRLAFRTSADPHEITVAALERHISLLLEAGLPALDPKALTGDEVPPPRGMVLTFDDATIDQLSVAGPILESHGLRGLFYLPTGRLGRPGFLAAGDVDALAEAGHAIGSHSHTHPRLTMLSPQQLQWELETSAATIEGIVGERPVHFAPPGGFHDRRVRDAAGAAGYTSLRTMEWGLNTSFDPMGLQVVPVTESALLLRAGLCRGGGPLLRSLHGTKQVASSLLPPAGYRALRSRLVAAGRRTARQR